MLFDLFAFKIRIQLLLSRTNISSQDSCYNLLSKIKTKQDELRRKTTKGCLFSV